jgi:hypothetical protein
LAKFAKELKLAKFAKEHEKLAKVGLKSLD